VKQVNDYVIQCKDSHFYCQVMTAAHELSYENLTEKDYLGDLGTHGRLILGYNKSYTN
jgi:hypothetical protein